MFPCSSLDVKMAPQYVQTLLYKQTALDVDRNPASEEKGTIPIITTNY